jgi:pilus assembly protein CpaF
MDNSLWKLLKELSHKKGITEVIINGPDHIYLEREGELIRLNAQVSLDDILQFCHEVAHLNHSTLDDSHPILDGLLPDGSRVNIVSQHYTSAAPAITIRKYLKEFSSFDDLKGKFGISQKWIEFFKALVQARSNILISGGTGVGKTTFLNLFLQELPPTQRIITIEDTKELILGVPNCVRLFSKSFGTNHKDSVDTRFLVKNCLRMRPDRIIMGEVRGAEAYDLLQIMNTGHDGSMCTIHANGPYESLIRLETLYLLSGQDIPLKAIRQQMVKALDYIIQLEKDRNSGRIVSRVSEVVGMEGEQVILQDIGVRAELGPEFTGLVPQKMAKLQEAGLGADFFMDI